MMQDTDQLLVNEFRKLERSISANKKKLDKLKARFNKQRGTLIDRRPQRYSTEFNFVPGSLQTQRQTFTTNGGTLFFCTEISSSVRVIGQSIVKGVSGQSVNLTRPYGTGVSNVGNAAIYRNEFFDYDWRVTDTSEDREWQNVQQPAPFMGSGSLSGMELPVAARIRGGAKVLVEVDPHFSIPFTAAIEGLFADVTTFVLHICFSGYEVPE